jgi:hypothetical protein
MGMSARPISRFPPDRVLHFIVFFVSLSFSRLSWNPLKYVPFHVAWTKSIALATMV